MVDRFQLLAIYRALRPLTPSSYRPFSSTAQLNIKKRMPPKKAAAQEKKILLGRPGNNLKIGIVGLFLFASFYAVLVSNFITGLPNVGKSSFFNALSETGKHPEKKIAKTTQIDSPCPIFL
jgi:obg-like ATPase 1